MSSAQRGVAIVEALLAAGVTDVVVAPGSRSAPLLLAVADAERRGLLRLHVRIDERSAAYLALGMARVAGRPVAVMTTSGTAAVNLHPAIVEAAYLGVPLVAVTADRPAALRGSGANQTIDQRDLFGVDATTFEFTGALADAEGQAVVEAVRHAWQAHCPVHLNVAFAEPLVEAGQHAVSAVPVQSAPAEPTRPRPSLSELAPNVDLRHGVLVVGDGPGPMTRAEASALAESMGWPIISEPSGNLSAALNALHHGPLLLNDDGFVTTAPPSIVVTLGRVGLHRSIARLLRAVPVHIAIDVPPYLRRVDPGLTAQAIVDAVPFADAPTVDPAWLSSWREADEQRRADVTEALAAGPLSGPVVARTVVESLGEHDLLVLGASWQVRHVSEFAGAIAAECIGNRGTSGIDGVMSTAWGAALARAAGDGGVTYALVGDLTAIYDRNGLLAPAGEPRPNLVYVVVDNDGGGIFSSLEQGDPAFAVDFERVFGTPLGADLSALVAAPGVSVIEVADVTALRQALRQTEGVHVVVARCVDRATEQAVAQRARGV